MKYEKIHAEVIAFDNRDVITASGCGSKSGSQGPWPCNKNNGANPAEANFEEPNVDEII